MNSFMALKDEFKSRVDEATKLIKQTLREENCSYDMNSHVQFKKGISIDFMFRNELDYSLVIPWEYVEDKNQILIYFLRFKHATENAKCIPEVERIADKFIDEELKQLRGS